MLEDRKEISFWDWYNSNNMGFRVKLFVVFGVEITFMRLKTCFLGNKAKTMTTT